jgi:cytosine/adenosine deaminase-related metal-dependent hydrolase
VLGRDDIGALVPGMAADVVAFDVSGVAHSGAAVHDPLAALVFCHAQNVDLAIVNGRVLVQDGKPLHLDVPMLVEKHTAAARALVNRAQ